MIARVPTYAIQLSSACRAQQTVKLIPEQFLPADSTNHDTMMGRNGFQLEDLDRRFSCALKAVDTTSTGYPSTPSLVDTSYFEHIASDIILIDYAQDLAFLPDLTKLAPNKLDYTGDNVIYTDHT